MVYWKTKTFKVFESQRELTNALIENMLTQNNMLQIKSQGLSEAEVKKQLQIFERGIPFANIVEAASVDKGIFLYSEKEQEDFVGLFESKKKDLDLLKFVPASGAATRMFSFLHQFLEQFNPNKDNIISFLQKSEHKDLKIFFNALRNFPFSDLVFKKLHAKFPDYENFEDGKRYYLFVQEMLEEDGMNFSNTPKGLVPFHRRGENYITAFGEQLFEAAFYATSNGTAHLHFTVSEEHEEKFKNRYVEIQDLVERKTQVQFKISYSFQNKETDTIAATLDNELFLDDKGNLVFRPAGHGALLDNLNNMDADIIFIKNIDNVVSENYVEVIAFHKKVLAGKLISLQQKIFQYVEELHTESPSEETLMEVFEFIIDELKISNPSLDKKSLLDILERPIRICGVVENTGAPGGGPFLVKNSDGKHSYQIVEMSQIDLKNPEQKSLVEKATHFNPVDLVCGVRNFKGEKYNLKEFSDPDSGFISHKTYQGKPIKALERPGLWNGAMADWITIFVEVPLITFNPVKTVNDLLNEVHQN